MKYDPRKHESNLSEDVVSPGQPSAGPPSPVGGSTLADLALLYEPEVFDLVREKLNHGKTHGQAVAALCEQDFSEEESNVIVRAVVEDRFRRGIVPVMPLIGLGLDFPQHNNIGDIETESFRRSARRTQGTREMAAGAALIGIGVVLTLVTDGTRAFYGAAIVGIGFVFRGAIVYLANNRR